ncbi:chloride channel protein [Pseudoxanthomonas winnipegensis]|nr:chloride channel protein [Pseudoxanthomonas winnipegensis]
MSYRPTTAHHDGLWWQIALGIFVGQLMTAAVLGILAVAFGAYTANEAERALRQMSVQMQQATRPASRSQAPANIYPSKPVNRPLSDGERCIKGERFKRLDNGWEQLRFDPC